MRSRVCALAAVMLLLAPLPALAAPDREEPETHASVVDSALSRFAETLARIFAADEEDNGPTIDPDGLVSAPTSTPEGDRLNPRPPSGT